MQHVHDHEVPTHDAPKDEAVEEAIAKLSNWGRWGRDDELGTVNFITAEARVRAAKRVKSGKVFSLAIPFDAFGPQPYRDVRLNPHHVMLKSGHDLLAGNCMDNLPGYGFSDDMVIMALQAATQWDALSHFFHNFKMYNDRHCSLVGPGGAEKNSITNLADKLVTRGILLDFPRALGVPWLSIDHKITQDEVETALEKARVKVESGDILLFRTGNMARARAKGGWDQFTNANEPGPGLELLPWFHKKQIAGVATDTWGFEVFPSGYLLSAPVHAVGIVYMGLLLGEIFDLEALAADCADDGVYEFMFSGAPLPFSKAISSPSNPVAIK